jgi:hypothetical protein
MTSTLSPQGLPRAWRTPVWLAAAAFLALPLVAMAFTAEVAWGPLDFALAALLLFGVAGAWHLASRRTADPRALAGTALALLTGLALVWINLAVGLIGPEGEAANLLFAVPLGLAAASALLPRRRPALLLAAAGAQAAIAPIAWALGSAEGAVVCLVFAAPWGAAGWLFSRAD